MRKIVNFATILFFVLLSFSVFAEDSVSVAPTVTKNASEKKLAKEIDDNLSLLLSSIKTASVSSSKGTKIDRCKDDAKCVVQIVAKKDSPDFVVVSKLTKSS